MGALGLGPALAMRPARAGAVAAPPPTGTPPAPFDFTTGALPAGATLTRASVAYQGAADGGLAPVAADQPRFDRDPVTGALRGLMLEAASTNALRWSEQMNAAGWDRNQAAAVPDQGPAPDGGLADMVVELGGGGPHGIAQAATWPGGDAVLSAHARAAGRGKGVMRLTAGGEVLARTRFDLRAGTVAGTGATLEKLGGGWFRVAIRATPAAGTVQAELLLSDDSGDEIYPGAGEGGVFYWGAVLEAGQEPGSFCYSDDARNARAADRLVLDWGARGMADGPATFRYRYHDGSVRELAQTVAGGRVTVPDAPPGKRLRTAEPA